MMSRTDVDSVAVPHHIGIDTVVHEGASIDGCTNGEDVTHFHFGHLVWPGVVWVDVGVDRA
ncbi:MAG: hypothetical protein WBB22_14240 [Anaerolineae bacterium]